MEMDTNANRNTGIHRSMLPLFYSCLAAGFFVSKGLGFSFPPSIPANRPGARALHRRGGGRSAALLPFLPPQAATGAGQSRTALSMVANATVAADPSARGPDPPAKTKPLSKNQEALSRRYFPRTWVPLASAYELDPDRPTPLEFLDQKYVCYHDPSTESGWVVVDDACPHRLAPLSEGRINRSSGGKEPGQRERTTLMCSYHGWEFDGGNGGACTAIPQATPEVRSRACNSPRAAVATYSVRVHKNVVWAWLWPEDPLSILQDFPRGHPEGIAEGITGGGEYPSTYTRDLPYGWDTLLENLIDPAHIPFAHHGLQGKREDAIPIDMTVPESFCGDDDGSEGFLFEWQDRTMKKHRGGTGEFKAPFGVAYNGIFYATKEEADEASGTHIASKRRKQQQQLAGGDVPGESENNEDEDDDDEEGNLGLFRLGVICIPTKPGWSRAIIFAGGIQEPKKDDTEEEEKASTGAEAAPKKKPKKKSLVAKIFGILPKWLVHLLSNRFLDSDLAFLHYQEQERRRYTDLNPGASANEYYYMPAQADRCISALRRWIPRHTDYLGGDGVTSNHSYQLPPPIDSRAVLFDRYKQHTSHCKHCQEGLEWLTTTVRKTASLVLVGSVLAGHCFRLFAGFKLLAKLVALASLGVLGLVSRIEPAFRVGEFKHYQND